MKKIILATAVVITTSLFFVGCSKNSGDVVLEYNIEEFGALYLETEKLFEAESEYLTEEEFDEVSYALYQECSKKTGLPFNQKIKLRGKKSSGYLIGFYVESTDGEYSIPCLYAGDNDLSLLVDDGEVVVVTGVFSESEGSYGCLSSASITSPKIDTTFSNNMAQILSNALINTNYYTDYFAIRGEVYSIQTLSEFEEYMAVSTDNNGYEHQDYYDDHVITLEGEKCFISFAYNPIFFPDIKVGDKIATQGCFETTRSYEVDETTTINWGFLGNVYSIYIYE